MEIMLDELSEDFNDHLAKSKATYYYVMNSDGNAKKLRLSVYSRGGDIECEVLMLPNYSDAGDTTCAITLDGEALQSRSGIISILPIPLNAGYHTLEFITSEGVSTARVRLTGVLSDSKEVA